MKHFFLHNSRLSYDEPKRIYPGLAMNLQPYYKRVPLTCNEPVVVMEVPVLVETANWIQYHSKDEQNITTLSLRAVDQPL